MTTLEDLTNAVMSRSPVSLHYASSEAPGQRVGHPHAVYIKKLKNGTEKTYVALWQTGGITHTGDIPGWRNSLILTKITDVKLLEGGPFPVGDGYNPDFYEFPIAMV